jgi:predicted RNase H-like nuclease
MGQTWLAGVDACRGGWIVAFLRPKGAEVRVRTERRFADVVNSPEKPEVVAIDIPIGLPTRSELGGRAPERMVRPFVGPRRSSVFRIPSRAAVYAGIDPAIPDDGERYRRACAIARTTSVDGKAFSKQGFYLFEKIVQVDNLLRVQEKLVSRVHETHPEVAFWRLNSDRPLSQPKKEKLGLALRRRLLVAAGFSTYVVNQAAPKGARPDDLIDALACAVIARRINAGVAESFPNAPPRDEFCLPMAIWA